MATLTPSAMATDLANLYISGAQNLLKTQSTKAQATSTALTKLQSVLRAFETSLSALTTKKSMVQRSATVTGSALTNASASATAQPGSYTLFVERVATQHQVAFEDLPAVPVSLGGPLVVQIGDGSSFRVDLTTADQNGDGTISNAEIARAINLAQNNAGKVTATTVTAGGKTQLVLNSAATGEQGKITLDTTELPDSDLKTALAGGRELVAARDAVVWVGQEGDGLRVQQSSNTFTAIDGVTATLSQAMVSGTPPIALTVANNDSGTAENLQAFVTAYNALEKALDELTAPSKEGTVKGTTTAGAAFASDAGVRSLRSRLDSALRQQVGGMNLLDYGIKTSRDGSISLDTDKLKKALVAKPDGLDALFGKTSPASQDGILSIFKSITSPWSDTNTGQVQQRQNSVQQIQKRITSSQDRLDLQYNSAYQRYLGQFTMLQNLQAQMDKNAELFSSMSRSSSSSS